MVNRSPSWREILVLALPALGALAAEPLYVLGDTAIVGHLGRVPLAGLALGGLLLSEIVGLCTFLEYGTTAKAARLYGAGERARAIDVGVQASWLALAFGLLIVVLLELAAAPAIRLMAGGETAAYEQALSWFRIAAAGAPLMLVIAAGQGWMRAFQDTRTGFYILLSSNVASVLILLLLVGVLGVGIEGSAIANLVAQAAAAAVFGWLLVRRAPSLRPTLSGILPQLAAARNLGVRSFAFAASFLVAAAVAARMGNAQVAAHQIGFQLWIFTALLLDSLAIAAQALIGGLLGAGDLKAAEALARRLLRGGTVFGIGVGAALAFGYSLVPALFSGDADVQAQAHVLWPWLIAMLPLAGGLFALDGVFFGAGDLRFMRTMTLIAALAGFLPLTLAASRFGWGLNGIWAALTAFISIRLVLALARWRSGRWLVAGTELVDEVASAGTPTT